MATEPTIAVLNAACEVFYIASITRPANFHLLVAFHTLLGTLSPRAIHGQDRTVLANRHVPGN